MRTGFGSGRLHLSCGWTKGVISFINAALTSKPPASGSSRPLQTESFAAAISQLQTPIILRLRRQLLFELTKLRVGLLLPMQNLDL